MPYSVNCVPDSAVCPILLTMCLILPQTVCLIAAVCPILLTVLLYMPYSAKCVPDALIVPDSAVLVFLICEAT